MLDLSIFGARSHKQAITDGDSCHTSLYVDKHTGKPATLDIWGLAPDGKTFSLQISGPDLDRLVTQIKGA